MVMPLERQLSGERDRPSQILLGECMNSNPKLFCAIAGILSGCSAGLAHGASMTDTGDSEGIQEIVVTAQRRAENMQDVPITIQALTAETLTQLSVTTFD